jgi:hypothetical protein
MIAMISVKPVSPNVVTASLKVASARRRVLNNSLQTL